MRTVDYEKTVFKSGDGGSMSHPDVIGHCCCDSRIASRSPTEEFSLVLRPMDARPDQYLCEISCPADTKMPDFIHVSKGSEVGPAWVYVLVRTVSKSGGVGDDAHKSPNVEGA